MRGMLLRVVVVSVSCLTVIGHEVSCRAAKPRGVLARIPANTQLYLYTANVAALEAKIRLMENQMNTPGGFDPIAALMREFGPGSGINFNRPAAIAVLAWPRPAAMVQPSVVALLASSKPTATLAEFGAKNVGNGIYQGTIPQQPIPLFMAVQGHYLVLSDQAASISKYLAAKAFLGPQLSATQRHFLSNSDLTLSLRVRSIYRMYRQQMKMLAQANGVRVKKKPGPANLSGSEFYRKAGDVLAAHILHQMITQVPQAMLTVRFARTGMLCRLIAIPRAGTAMAKMIQAQRPLGKTPFVGLPAGRYVAASAMAIDGAPVAAWLGRAALVWDKHASIRSNKRYTDLKKQMALGLSALADLRGLSQINYADNRPMGQDGLGIQVLDMAHAGTHLQQILAWLKHPPRLAFAHSAWDHARWTITPAALKISNVPFTRVSGKFPRASTGSSPPIPPGPPGLLPGLPRPQSVFGSDAVSLYAGVVGNRIIFADARAAKKLPEVVEQIQKHQQNLPQLGDIAELTAWEPAHARLLIYLPLARWASLARRQSHPGADKPVAGAVVIGAPVPPLLISGSVVGGCMVYRVYTAYSLMSTVQGTWPWGGLAF